MCSKNITACFRKTIVLFGDHIPYLRLKHLEQKGQVKGLCATSKDWSDLGDHIDWDFSNAAAGGEAYAPF